MNKLIIANWKMNFTLPEATSFCQEVQNNVYKNDLIICAPAPFLGTLAAKFNKITFAAQNVSIYQNFGAHTGQFSSMMLKSCGINYNLIGHSECRQAFRETNYELSVKVENCLNDGLVPILCIGESLTSRRNGYYVQDILQQLAHSLPKNLTITPEKKIIIAYEPIWSIGTDLVPDDQQLTEIFYHLNSYLKQSLFANSVQLVYGGSANINNIARLSTIKHIDGLLLGKASLDVQQLLEILNF